MTAYVQTTASSGSPGDSRRRARAAGVWFIITFVTSIPALLLYDPALNDTGYILGGGADSQIYVAALLEVLLIIANVATAVVLFPVLRRQDETLALGFVASRIIESTMIGLGIISLLAIVTLRGDFSSSSASDATSLNVAGHSLVAIKNWTFLMGPGFCVAVGNGMLLGYLMYRSGLVPRRMAMLGVIGGPLIFASSVAILFGAYEQSDPIAFLFSIPEIAWEASLGVYLTVWGFRPSPVLAPA